MCFLKKSGNEKNTVIRIGEKIKRPTPGANSDPNDAVMTCDAEFRGINPASSAPRAVGVLSSDWIYLKGLLCGFRSLCRL